jgi:hypothetical protein
VPSDAPRRRSSWPARSDSVQLPGDQCPGTGPERLPDHWTSNLRMQSVLTGDAGRPARAGMTADRSYAALATASRSRARATYARRREAFAGRATRETAPHGSKSKRVGPRSEHAEPTSIRAHGGTLRANAGSVRVAPVLGDSLPKWQRVEPGSVRMRPRPMRVETILTPFAPELRPVASILMRVASILMRVAAILMRVASILGARDAVSIRFAAFPASPGTGFDTTSAVSGTVRRNCAGARSEIAAVRFDTDWFRFDIDGTRRNSGESGPVPAANDPDPEVFTRPAVPRDTEGGVGRGASVGGRR